VIRKTKAAAPEVVFTAYVWKEGGAYIACAPELDTSSCGNSVAEARDRLREAVRVLLEESSNRGTLDAVLAEAGFERHGRIYRAPRILARTNLRLPLPLAS